MVDDTDRSFGDLLDHLEVPGIEDSTYVIFTRIMGVVCAETLLCARSESGSDGRRDSCAIHCAGTRRLLQVVIAHCRPRWDLLPTLYDLAGGSKKLPEGLDGVSLLPALYKGDRARLRRPGDALVFHFPCVQW